MKEEKEKNLSLEAKLPKDSQLRLAMPKVKYSYGSYNKIKGDMQRIRITEGCPHNHPYCYEPTEIKVFGVPEIERNKVQITDMNLLCKEECISLIKELGSKRVNNKVIYYELMCGIDYRFLTEEIAELLYKYRFGKFNKNGIWSRNIRIAWDMFYRDQFAIKDAIDKLVKAEYKPNEIMIFMICNWKIPFEMNCNKLDLCKIWGVQVSDCYYDNQTFKKGVIPIYWTSEQNKTFRKMCRRHNQLVTFRIDPEVKL